jgi:hypothetical protein
MTDERHVFVGTLVLLLVVSGVAGVASSGRQTPVEPVEPVDVAPSGEYRVTEAGVRYTVHPSELRQGCPGGTDCIPSIDDPRFQPAGAADWLEPSDLVVGVEFDGEARAYPLRILTVHEIVNDRVAGRPVAVTYCPLCRSGLVFSREVGNATLEFGVSGKLHDANLVMYDRETETYWSQLDGNAIVGPQVPRSLRILPSTITTWERWEQGHPETTVLSRDTGIYPASVYGSDPYAGYANSSRVGFGVDRVDERLPTKELVYGVTAGGASAAYPESVVRSRDVINDEVGGVPVLVLEVPDDGSVRVFVRETGNGTRSFDAGDGVLVDDRGNRWSYDGEALEGPRAGTRLERLPTHGVYWFAWSSFNPETDVYGENTTDPVG